MPGPRGSKEQTYPDALKEILLAIAGAKVAPGADQRLLGALEQAVLQAVQMQQQQSNPMALMAMLAGGMGGAGAGGPGMGSPGMAGGGGGPGGIPMVPGGGPPGVTAGGPPGSQGMDEELSRLMGGSQ